MKKKKVVIVGSAYPLRGGGISTFNERLSKAFNEGGYESIIYNFSLQYPKIFFPGKNQYTDEPGPENLDIRIRINSVNPFNWIKVGNEIRKLSPYIVVFRYWIPFMAPCFGTIARRIRKDKKIVVVSIVDNIVPHESKLGDRMLSQYFVNSMQGFVLMSGVVNTSLLSFDKIKPRILTSHPLYDNYGNAIPKKLAREKLGLDLDQKYLLFFGFIRDYKGLDLLLHALTDERVRKKDLKLLVVGEFYTSPEPYLEFIKSNYLENNIILINKYIVNNEVPLYFSACDIVVQPYKNATQSGVSQVALHFGKPIITTNVGGLAEMISDKVVGRIVLPDSHELVDAIIWMFEENVIDEIEKNMATEKLKYSWDNMIKSVDELYSLVKND